MMNESKFEKMENDAENYQCSPIWAEEDSEIVIGYMCLTDFECELGGASDGNHIYPSLSSLLANRRCALDCGIAQVDVKLRKILLIPARNEELIKIEDGCLDIPKEVRDDRENYVMELERQIYNQYKTEANADGAKDVKS